MYLEKEEMRLAILYTLSRYHAPISMERISLILTWEKEILEYFELSVLLAELLEDGYVTKKFYMNEETYALTRKGEEANGFFGGRIPKSVRNRIDQAVGNIKYDEQIDPNVVKCEILPLDERQYMASCQILDSKVPLLELKLHVGTRANAEKVVKYLQGHSEELYQGILKLCMPELRSEKEKS